MQIYDKQFSAISYEMRMLRKKEEKDLSDKVRKEEKDLSDKFM